MTVTYVYEDGASAYTTFEQSWTYGVDYRIPSPAIENHTADQTVVEGRADGQPRSVSVTYKLNEVVADTSAETTEPVASEPEAEKPGVGTVIAVVIMVLVLAGIGVGAFLLIRSDKKNAGKNTTTVRKKPDEKAAKNAKKKQNKKQ